MARRPITNPLEYLQVARRRWIWIVVPTMIIAGLTAVVARKLPKLYTSSALILIEPQQVPTDMVHPTVSGTVADRLEYIREQILSRTQLSQIIQKYGLYRNQGLTADGQVTQMLGDIAVTPILDPNAREGSQDYSAFRIAYQGPDPVLAQDVTRELSQLFISENLKARAQQAVGTENFIDSQVAQASQTLQTLEAQLKQLKNQYMGALPEQQGANLQVLGQLQTVLQADNDAIARAQQQKTYLDSLDQAVAGMTTPMAAAPKPLTPAEQELATAKTNLALAEQMYTPEHPDVIRLKQQVKALTAAVAAQAKDTQPAKAADGKPLVSPAEKGQIAVLNEEIAQRQKDLQETRAKIAALQKRVEQLPEVEEKLANLQNAYDVAKANYTTLLEKKAAAATGAAMEQQAEGEEFRIVDPANLPQKPTSPDIVRIELMGGAGALVVGLGLGFLMEMRDPVVRSEADVNFYTHVPLLAALPRLQIPRTRAARRALGAGGQG